MQNIKDLTEEKMSLWDELTRKNTSLHGGNTCNCLFKRLFA